MSRTISRYKRKNERKKIASESLLFLRNILDEDSFTNHILSDSVARSILRLGKRHGVRTSPKIYQKICRKCHVYLVPGKNSRIRISNGFVLNTCITCHRTYRFKLDKNR
jgi:ribonuclease P protein subunit RPR2